jgi:hypothetical protein
MPKKDEPGRHDRDECQLCKEIDAKVAAGLAKSAWPFPTTMTEDSKVVWTPEDERRLDQAIQDRNERRVKRKAAED